MANCLLIVDKDVLFWQFGNDTVRRPLFCAFKMTGVVGHQSSLDTEDVESMEYAWASDVWMNSPPSVAGGLITQRIEEKNVFLFN